MENNLILNFLQFPHEADQFITYEDKIHIEISNQFNDTRALLLMIMKNTPISIRKKYLDVKKTFDNLSSQFEVIKSSIISIPKPVDNKLTFNHEFILIIDFLIFERLLDFNDALRDIENKMMIDINEEYISFQASELHNSLRKLDNLLKIRKIAHQISPSDQMFNQFSSEFEGQISYLETIGVVHQFEELSKPSIFGKRKHKKKLSQLFISTCQYLQEQKVASVSFVEFTELFRKRYPKVEFDPRDLIKVAKDLRKSGIIGLTDNKDDNQPSEVILTDGKDIQQEIIKIAKKQGYVSTVDLVSSIGRDIKDINNAIKKLEDAGLAIVDNDYATGKRVYFPGLEAEKGKN